MKNVFVILLSVLIAHSAFVKVDCIRWSGSPAVMKFAKYLVDYFKINELQKKMSFEHISKESNCVTFKAEEDYILKAYSDFSDQNKISVVYVDNFIQFHGKKVGNCFNETFLLTFKCDSTIVSFRNCQNKDTRYIKFYIESFIFHFDIP